MTNPHIIALHPDGTRAIRLGYHKSWHKSRTGLAVDWSDATAYCQFQRSDRDTWSLEDWSKVKLISFSDVPVGRVGW